MPDAKGSLAGHFWKQSPTIPRFARPPVCVTVEASMRQTWKKLILVCKPTFRVGKCPQNHIVAKHIK